MLDIFYAPTFVRMYKGLPPLLKEEVKEKINLFRNRKNHDKLAVHKLRGNLQNAYSFSVNFKIRIVFEYATKKAVNLLYVGDHDGLYK